MSSTTYRLATAAKCLNEAIQNLSAGHHVNSPTVSDPIRWAIAEAESVLQRVEGLAGTHKPLQNGNGMAAPS